VIASLQGGPPFAEKVFQPDSTKNRVENRPSTCNYGWGTLPKAARHYIDIRQRIEQGVSVDHFLYLVPNYDLLWFVADKLSECRRTVYFGLLREFLQQTLMLPVRRTGSPTSVTLASVLTLGKEAQRTGSLFPGIAV
jgi:hypothetical protein